jgi:hypothetical protein
MAEKILHALPRSVSLGLHLPEIALLRPHFSSFSDGQRQMIATAKRGGCGALLYSVYVVCHTCAKADNTCYCL